MYRGVEAVVINSNPRNKWVLGVSLVGGVWAHRMAEVYAPQILADLVIAHTIKYLGSATLGFAVGTMFVAPGVVPTLVPVAAYLSAVIMIYALVLGGNGVCGLLARKGAHASKVSQNLS